MSRQPTASIQAHCSGVTDPRIDRTKPHPLINILTMALCAVICGAATWVDIEHSGTAKRDWLGKTSLTMLRPGGGADLECALHETGAGDHGRIELRRHWITSDLAWLEAVTGNPLWPGLRRIGMVEAERQIGQETTRETRDSLASLESHAAQLAHAVRSHWGIEHSVQWVLDVAFREMGAAFGKTMPRKTLLC